MHTAIRFGLSGLAAAALAVASHTAWAVPASGDGPGQSPVILDFEFDVVVGANGWTYQETVTHEPGAGPIQKRLDFDDDPLPGTTFVLSETITIGSLGTTDDPIVQVWSDWHEELVFEIPEWQWGAVSLAVNGSTAGVTSTVTPTGGAVFFPTVDFFFSAQSGDVLTIQKEIICSPQPGANGCLPFLLVREFPTVPTVPEPATLALVGLGLLGLGGAARRRRG